MEARTWERLPHKGWRGKTWKGSPAISPRAVGLKGERSVSRGEGKELGKTVPWGIHTIKGGEKVTRHGRILKVKEQTGGFKRGLRGEKGGKPIGHPQG